MLDMYREVCNMKERKKTGVLITVVDKKGQGPAVVGRKMLMYEDGSTKGTIGGGNLEYLAIKKARELLKDRKNYMETYDFTGEKPAGDAVSLNMICGGLVTLYYEYIGISPRVFIFGAGHVGICITKILENMDYDITLVDDRSDRPTDLSGRHEYILGDYKDVIGRLDMRDGCFVVIAGYTHEIEYEILKAVYKKDCRPKYIGMLASKNKASYMIEKLKDELGNEPDLSVFYSPIGLDIGGSSPEEIAISIASEIQSVRYEKENCRHLTANWV